MKHSRIELATEFDESGVPTKYETFITRQNISFSLVYECVSFLASLKENPDDDELHVMLDIVTRIFDSQFSKNQLIEGLEAYSATYELYKHIVFVASGQSLDSEVESNEEISNTKVNGWEEHRDNLKSTIQKMVKEGEQSYNDVLDLPFFMVFDELSQKAKEKPTHKSNMLEAFA